jgi:hypothetical protein
LFTVVSEKPGEFSISHAFRQNSFKSKTGVKLIVHHGETHPSDIVLEIGPGLCNMTKELVSHGWNIVLGKQRKDFFHFKQIKPI